MYLPELSYHNRYKVCITFLKEGIKILCLIVTFLIMEGLRKDDLFMKTYESLKEKLYAVPGTAAYMDRVGVRLSKEFLLARKEKGWFPEQMASFLNISMEALSLIEQGDSSLTETELLSLLEKAKTGGENECL